MKFVTFSSCLVASLLLATSVALAEAPVVDESENLASSYNNAGSGEVYQEPVIRDDQQPTEAQDNYMKNAAPANAQVTAEDDISYAEGNSKDPALLLSKLNALQREVQQLRGQLEVQSHELKSLQQTQQTFYKDLDSRLASISHGKTAVATKSTSAASDELANTVAPPAHPVNHPAGGLSSMDEQAAYAAAYDKLKNKQFDESIVAMKNFLQQYPNSDNAVNAHYWLGELYLIKKQAKLAMAEFNTVLHQYPNSLKTDAAMLKLGYAYADLGDYKKAKELLLKVEKRFPDSTTAKLAANRIAIMKQSGKS